MGDDEKLPVNWWTGELVLLIHTNSCSGLVLSNHMGAIFKDTLNLSWTPHQHIIPPCISGILTPSQIQTPAAASGMFLCDAKAAGQELHKGGRFKQMRLHPLHSFNNVRLNRAEIKPKDGQCSIEHSFSAIIERNTNTRVGSNSYDRWGHDKTVNDVDTTYKCRIVSGFICNPKDVYHFRVHYWLAKIKWK